MTDPLIELLEGPGPLGECHELLRLLAVRILQIDRRLESLEMRYYAREREGR
jgi:hypothetical protein